MSGSEPNRSAVARRPGSRRSRSLEFPVVQFLTGTRCVIAKTGGACDGKMRTMKPHWAGVFPAVTTQITKSGALDLAATARHVEALLASGVTGIIALGSLGENQALTAAEKREVIQSMIDVVRGRVPVLSGVAESSTAEACRYAR